MMNKFQKQLNKEYYFGKACLYAGLFAMYFFFFYFSKKKANKPLSIVQQLRESQSAIPYMGMALLLFMEETHEQS